MNFSVKKLTGLENCGMIFTIKQDQKVLSGVHFKEMSGRAEKGIRCEA